MHALCGTDVGQDGCLGYEVSDHEEAATSYIECTEESLLDPVGEFLYTAFVAAELIIIEVIDDNIVRS